MERAEIMAWRRQQRTSLLAARMAMPPAAYKATCAAIAAHLEQDVRWLAGLAVGIYWPFKREFDPLPFAHAHLEHGGAILLPVVVAKNQPLEFRAWTPETAMVNGVYDIPHPAEGPAVAPDALLVPLVGFDSAGYRLGYGGGYYDRTLEAGAGRPRTVGIGFELSRLPTIYPLPHDVPLDFVVTEAGTFNL